MITVTRNNSGDVILLHIDGTPYTPDALREQIELAQWAARRRESNRLASQRYEAKVGRAARNAVRAKRAREDRRAATEAQEPA